MSDDREYIWIVGWEKHQDALRKRGKPWAPPWIKLSPAILDDDTLNDLPEATQLLFLKLLTLFARSTLTVRKDTRSLSRSLNQRVLTRQLEALNHAGLIEFCSGTVLEQRRNAFWNSSSLEEKKNRTPPTPHGRKASRSDGSNPRRNGTNPRARHDVDPMSRLPYGCPHCNQRRATETELAEHLENVHGITAAAAGTDPWDAA